MSKILLAEWSANFAMDDEIKSERSNNWIGKSHFLFEIWKWRMPTEGYVYLVGEEIIYALYNMVYLVDLV